ncbi:LytTR family DNA-binding domain-containing protein [Anaerostipes sp.]|uniref:LytTR family DNA-binding domain-containing protein n=1 Tax=Anaerostipes sp. TaxID=1872530 RepID=UPI0025BC4773|nr:LytTR family DNA-binding domain-containing protein [Anaerostipes sp.]MBS7007737.1 LytTR family transcriptional regulator [Anaerostipes sp.]
MKIRIEIDENLAEEEIIIRCASLNETVREVQKAVRETSAKMQTVVFSKGEQEYYFPLSKVLFFETDGNVINVHTADDIYETKYRLYELEEMLPGSFMRISKSAVVNTHKIYSISRGLSASGVIQFENTHKQVYVSRLYLKPLKQKLEEKRIGK